MTTQKKEKLKEAKAIKLLNDLIINGSEGLLDMREIIEIARAIKYILES